MLVPSLLHADLPHMEEVHREAGTRTSLWENKAEGGIQLDESDPASSPEKKDYTRWQILVAIWGGYHWTIFISRVSFVQMGLKY